MADISESAANMSDEPMFGILDIFLVGLSIGLGIYFFFFRGNKKEKEVKPIQPIRPIR